MAKNVFFALHPSLGHVNAVLAIARELSSTSHQVYFDVNNDQFLEKYIQHQGHSIYSLGTIPFGLNFSDELNYYKKYGSSKRNLILDRISNEAFTARLQSISIMLGRLEPCTIFLDAFIGADYVCWHSLIRRSDRFYFINTMGPTRCSAAPPANRAIAPKKKLLTTLAWIVKDLHSFFARQFEHLYTLGHSNAALLKRKIHEQGLSKTYTLIDNQPISITFDSIPELVLSFPSFDYGKNDQCLHFRNRIYLGLQVDFKRKDLIHPKDLRAIQQLNPADKKIIYISFGTHYRTSTKIKRFMKTLVEITSLMGGYFFVFANFENLDLFQKISQSKNYLVAGQLPQLYFLERSVLFITHAGMNAIKEAIFCGTPMLAVPANAKYDQTGNAKKIEMLKIGRYIKPCLFNSHSVQKNIAEILADEEYLKNLNRLRAQIKEEFPMQKIKDLINSL